MKRAMLWLLLAALCSVARGEVVVVYTFNNEFSVNQPGEPIVDPVISVGDTVQWVWLQGNHTTTSVSGSAEQWNAALNSSSTVFEHTFTLEGVFHYYCIPHGADNGDGTASGMAGTITVLSSAVGACCVPSGGCVETTAAGCDDLGGSFLGEATSCAGDPCSTKPVTLELTAVQDNVLYETVDGSSSNALGTRLFTGNQNSGERRRSVVAFDLCAVPAGAQIQSAELRMFCTESSGEAFAVALHRLTASWGEGTSVANGNQSSGGPATAGDATWLHRFYPDQFWSAPGGDFLADVSAAALISAQNTAYLWSGAGLTGDVQQWVDAPQTNFGWIIRGDESGSANTKRFESRESNTAANRPTLIVTYVPGGAIGACCFTDGSCAELTPSDCASSGGEYRGDGTVCETVVCPLELVPFVDPLPRPGVAQPVVGAPGQAAHYEIAMTEQFQKLHRDLPPTRVWGYNGSYPGPTIEAWRGEPVTVTWQNDLRVAETGELRTAHVLSVDECLHGPDMTGQVPVTVVHLHGGKVGPESDGYPEHTFAPGEQSTLYTYPNEQPAATIWYHDHALGITRLNVMMGLAGFYLIRDEQEAALGLPSGEYEVPLAIQDRSFHPDGSLRYPEQWQEHFFGDTIVVNGKVWPYLDVDRGKYRMRLLNGSNSRAYTLALSDGAEFWQIGSDLGLLEAPVQMTELTLLPGERADVVLDFAPYAPGTELILTNSAPAPFPGFPGVGVVPEVMKFIVGEQAGHTAELPTVLASVPRIPESEAIRERVLDLVVVPNTHCPAHEDGMWTIDGLMWNDITEFPVLGTTEIWSWRNDSGISHPMHVHLVMSQVLNRQALDPVSGEPTGPLLMPNPGEMGWKDTINAPPGYITRVIMRFEGFTGLYPYHCHILEHEDHEMMRQFEVVACPVDWPCPGDANGDGATNLTDLNLVLANFGAGPGAAYTDGDLDCDGFVNLADLNLILANFGCAP